MKRALYIFLLVSFILSLAVFCASAQTSECVNDSCKWLVSEGNKDRFLDKSYNTSWVPEGSDPLIRIMLPEGGAGYIEIGWKKLNTDFTLTQYNEAQQEISVITHADDPNGYYYTQTYDLLDDARYVFLSFHQENQGVNVIRVFSRGELPPYVNHWKPQHEKCDLMVISTHMDDEWLWFGGIIPYYNTVAKKNVQIMYMANCGRFRYNEALKACSVVGVQNMPVFLGLKDERIGSFNETLDHWGGAEAVLERVVEKIRMYKPEVILTHDWNGEYGHNQHKITSRCMEYAIEYAADETKFPQSVAAYGTWQVKKLYRHLETKCPIEFDWHIPYEELGGRTCLQAATDAMEQNKSQLKAYQVQDHGKYDNAKFGLSYTVVGEDVLHNDLFENLY